MSTTGQFSSRNPTIKRILKEAAELASQPSSDYHAAPLETDLFEWHFTLRGAPAPSPFEGGTYHGRIVLPPAYPLKPPSFRFLTPTGRFEVNREICLSISGHHEETWQPAWGIRTALVALRTFMDTDSAGQLGGMDASAEMRKRLATQSPGWKCPVCGKGNGEILKEQEGLVEEKGEKVDEAVPEELRLAYRDAMGGQKGDEKGEKGAKEEATASPMAAEKGSVAATPNLADPSSPPSKDIQSPPAATSSSATSRPVATGTETTPVAAQARPPQQQPVPAVAPWVDKAIIGVISAILLLLYQRYML